uniref:Actin-related protein 6 n=1 Tax=Huperzia serrata TaxID=355589 RepID=A0A481ZLC0_HUPSR|nr:actin-related protein 6 [Huperzia serrata]
MVEKVVVLDSGAGFCKAGFAGQDDPVAIVPNCLARPRGSKRWLLPDHLHDCDDIQGLALRRPMDRGYLISPDIQKQIWDHLFKALLKVKPADCALLLVEPPFTLPSIHKMTDELVFEDLGFHSYCVADAPSLVHIYEANRRPQSLLARSDCSLVVDSGFSFTHATPVFQKFSMNYAVRRLNLGGKALTNYLKELVSYRAWNMMDETYLMEDVKEKLCFCSMNVPFDLDVSRKRGIDNYIKCNYVLPDGVKYKRGFVKDPSAAAAVHLKKKKLEIEVNTKCSEKESVNARSVDGTSVVTPEMRRNVIVVDEQELTLTNERFMVPEMLFHPADLGMEEAGLAECIVRAVSACHPDLQGLFYSSVVLTGGSMLFPWCKEKLELELRPLVPDEFDVHVTLTDSPITSCWRGGSLLAASPEFGDCLVSKRDYEEQGSLRCRRRFFH